MESYRRGVLSEKNFKRDTNRRMVSLQHCFMGWLMEIMGSIMVTISPMLYDLGFLNVYYINVIMSFLIIPIMHLINNEETKGIVSESNWFNGLRHLLGLRRISIQQNLSCCWISFKSFDKSCAKHLKVTIWVWVDWNCNESITKSNYISHICV